MAYTFLDKINDSLKEVGEIQGSDGELTTFTDVGRQRQIDVMIKAWNDAISQIQDMGAFAGEEGEGTITLADNTREYAYESDFSKITGKFINESDNRILTEFPGGYQALRTTLRNPADFRGWPNYYVINPVTKKFMVDLTPTSAEAGIVYKYTYEKYAKLAVITDTFRWDDRIVDAIQDPAVQRWERKIKGQFDKDTYYSGLAHVARLMRQAQPTSWYGVRRASAR